ncbi:MAG TPA: hypothetical protein VLB85_08360 [Acidimicrobiia bacterium]|nr:hypothetical protein [Acidimicrobiia bacterium]
MLLTCIAVGLLLAACSVSDLDSDTGTVTGIVVDVVGELNDVESFTVLADGEQHTFALLPGADYAFPPGHLRDHLRSGDPVRVDWEDRDGARVAVTLDDG